MELTNVFIRPLLTEKSYAKKSEANKKKKYGFIVNIHANKIDIALAFQTIFEIQPESITTMIRKSVTTRTGTIHPGYTKKYKIAYITLPEGKSIVISKEEFEEKTKNTKKDNEANKVEEKKEHVAKEVTKPIETNINKPTAENKKEGWRKSTNKNY